MTIRIAFFPLGGRLWTGGSVYLRNLLSALKTSYPERIETVLILPSEAAQDLYANLLPYVDEVLLEDREGQPDTDDLAETLDDSEDDTESSEPSESPEGGIRWNKFFADHRIDVVFGQGFSKYFRFPTIGWIPDFQPLHLPEMFGERTLQVRLNKDRGLANRVTKVILSSHNAYEDFCKFVPDQVQKAAVVSFVTPIPPEVYDLDLNAICQQYHLPEKFFYLPNQFWKHKNHQVVFKAAQILKSRGVQIFLACTGNPFDHRNPNHFSDLFQMASEWDIRDQIAFLGMLPHEHVYALMRQSLCLINPSLFEGWSTTVEEAKSLGKSIALSDIPVHREQNPAGAVYFDPNNAEALADLLEQLWNTEAPGADRELEVEARAQLASRREAFAQSFLDVINSAIEQHAVFMEEYRIQQMTKVAHIVNPVVVDEASDLYTAQPITFETMRTAQAAVAETMRITLLSAQYADDRPIVPDGFEITPDLERSVLDLPIQAEHERKLPLFKDVLDRLYTASDAEYLIYTNVDIALMPHFYSAIERFIKMGHDAFVIHHRTIPKRYSRIAQIPLMYGEIGEPHPGFACFVFHRDLYPKFQLGNVCVGVPGYEKVLLANLIGCASQFEIFSDQHLTFHIGSDRSWANQNSAPYREHNDLEALRLIAQIKADVGSDQERRDRLDSFFPNSMDEVRVKRFAHIINPVVVSKESDLYVAQPVTFRTMKTARSEALPDVDVMLLSAQYPEDRSIVPNGFQMTPDLERSILDFGTFQNKRKLPVLKDILDRLYEASDAEYLIYTNVDIGLMPLFYSAIAHIINTGCDAFVINRRTIPKRFDTIKQIPLMYGEAGQPHPGYDCFVFRRDAYPKYNLGNICVGVRSVGSVLLANMMCHAEKFKIFEDKHLTFHIGDDRSWKSEKNTDYMEHNEREFLQVIDKLKTKTDNPEHLEFLDSLLEKLEKTKRAEARAKARAANAQETDAEEVAIPVEQHRSKYQKLKADQSSAKTGKPRPKTAGDTSKKPRSAPANRQKLEPSIGAKSDSQATEKGSDSLPARATRFLKKSLKAVILRDEK